MNSLFFMFSDIADTSRSAALMKKARIERSCDICRKKKSMSFDYRSLWLEEFQVLFVYDNKQSDVNPLAIPIQTFIDP